MSEIFFTADQHLGHAGILSPRTMNRGELFDGLDAMNEHLVNQWRETVGPDDTVICLGDLFYRIGKTKVLALLHRLTGARIIVKPGNHDDEMFRKLARQGELPPHFALLPTEEPVLLDYRMNGQLVFMHHWWMETWLGKDTGSFLLHGHSHGAREGQVRGTLDVGWDVHKKLLTFDDVSALLQREDDDGRAERHREKTT